MSDLPTSQLREKALAAKPDAFHSLSPSGAYLIGWDEGHEAARATIAERVEEMARDYREASEALAADGWHDTAQLNCASAQVCEALLSELRPRSPEGEKR